MALPARGSHSDIQGEKRREGGRKTENSIVRKEGRGGRMSRRAPETGGFKALRSFGVTLQLKTIEAEEADCDSCCVYEGH